MPRAPERLDEFELIRRYFLRSADTAIGVALGIGDDAALLEVPTGEQLVAAVDTLVAGRHFLPSTPARSIGHRALAVNLSDMAAMGATPRWATLALTLPQADPQWLQDFAAGFLALGERHGVTLVGGDTTRGPLTISVQIMGTVPAGGALRRDAARAGDLLVVSGTLGDAGAGLKFAQESPRPSDKALQFLIERFDFPTPRVQLGVAARGLASAAMDISDGLVGDLPKILDASHLAAVVDVERLPVSSALRAVVAEEEARELALGAGDDYELLLCLPPVKLQQLVDAARRLNLTLSVIGELRAGAGIRWTLHGADFAPRLSGFNHFD
ncbi:MAG TPA: thiamine-phosphate kinase [Steroidobacteraceae bacterium]|jgi:thiamine-monophosphate kinase